MLYNYRNRLPNPTYSEILFESSISNLQDTKHTPATPLYHPLPNLLPSPLLSLLKCCPPLCLSGLIMDIALPTPTPPHNGSLNRRSRPQTSC